jgi:hypothetical protein
MLPSAAPVCRPGFVAGQRRQRLCGALRHPPRLQQNSAVCNKTPEWQAETMTKTGVPPTSSGAPPPVSPVAGRRGPLSGGANRRPLYADVGGNSRCRNRQAEKEGSARRSAWRTPRRGGTARPCPPGILSPSGRARHDAGHDRALSHPSSVGQVGDRHLGQLLAHRLAHGDTPPRAARRDAPPPGTSPNLARPHAPGRRAPPTDPARQGQRRQQRRISASSPSASTGLRR